MTEPRPPIYSADDDWPEPPHNHHRQIADENERLRMEVSGLMANLQSRDTWIVKNGHWSDFCRDVDGAFDSVERLREALEFYGWEDHWARKGYEMTVCEEDRGRRARATLAKIREMVG